MLLFAHQNLGLHAENGIDALQIQSRVVVRREGLQCILILFYPVILPLDTLELR